MNVAEQTISLECSATAIYITIKNYGFIFVLTNSDNVFIRLRFRFLVGNGSFAGITAPIPNVFAGVAKSHMFLFNNN